MNRFCVTCLVLTVLCVGVLDIAWAEEVRGSGQGVYVQQSRQFLFLGGRMESRSTSGKAFGN